MEKLQFFQETGHKQTMRQVDHTMSKNVCIFMALSIQLRNSHIKILNFVQLVIDVIDTIVPPFNNLFFIRCGESFNL